MNHVPAVSLVLLFGSMTLTAQSLVLDKQPAVLNLVQMVLVAQLRYRCSIGAARSGWRQTNLNPRRLLNTFK